MYGVHAPVGGRELVSIRQYRRPERRPARGAAPARLHLPAAQARLPALPVPARTAHRARPPSAVARSVIHEQYLTKLYVTSHKFPVL